MIKILIPMFMFLLIISMSYAAVNWIRPSDLRDDLAGLLIYNGNISITFDGNFNINNSGSNMTDTNESVRFNILVGTDCSGTDKMIGVNSTGGVLCAADVTGSSTGSYKGDGTYLYNDTTTIYFNETYLNTTIDEKLSTTVYYPNTTKTIGGANISGNINLMWYYDNIYYNITEGNGINPLDVYINFTNITSFNSLVLREYYFGSTSHHMLVQIYDSSISDWEEYWDFVGQEGFNVLNLPILDTADHLINGSVMVRLHHIENGIASHILYLDYVQLQQGITVTSSTNLEGYAKYNFNYNNFVGNGNFTTSNEVKAYKLTAEGELIVKSIATMQNITPTTNNLYSLGNTTHWWNNAYITNLYNQNFYGNFINASEVNTTNINSYKMNTSRMEVNNNMTLGGYVLKKQDNDLILLLN